MYAWNERDEGGGSIEGRPDILEALKYVRSQGVIGRLVNDRYNNLDKVFRYVRPDLWSYEGPATSPATDDSGTILPVLREGGFLNALENRMIFLPTRDSHSAPVRKVRLSEALGTVGTPVPCKTLNLREGEFPDCPFEIGTPRLDHLKSDAHETGSTAAKALFTLPKDAYRHPHAQYAFIHAARGPQFGMLEIQCQTNSGRSLAVNAEGQTTSESSIRVSLQAPTSLSPIRIGGCFFPDSSATGNQIIIQKGDNTPDRISFDFAEVVH